MAENSLGGFESKFLSDRRCCRVSESVWGPAVPFLPSFDCIGVQAARIRPSLVAGFVDLLVVVPAFELATGWSLETLGVFVAK